MRRGATVTTCLLVCLLLGLPFAASKKCSKDVGDGYEYDDYGDGDEEAGDLYESENVAEEEQDEFDEEGDNNDEDYDNGENVDDNNDEDYDSGENADDNNAEEELDYTINTPKVFPTKQCHEERKQVEKKAEKCLINALMPKFESATYQGFFSKEEINYKNYVFNDDRNENRHCHCKTAKPTCNICRACDCKTAKPKCRSTKRPTCRPTPKPTSRPAHYKCKCKCKKCNPVTTENQRDKYGRVPIYLGEVTRNKKQSDTRDGQRNRY